MLKVQDKTDCSKTNKHIKILIGPIPTILSHCQSFQWAGNTWQSLMGHLSVVKAVFLWVERFPGTVHFHWLLVHCVPCLAHECGRLTTQPQYCCATVIFFSFFLNGFKISEWKHFDCKIWNISHRDLKPEKSCENKPLYLCVSSLLSADCWFFWDHLKCLQSWWSVTKVNVINFIK